MLKLWHNYEGGKLNYDKLNNKIKSQKYVIVYVIM